MLLFFIILITLISISILIYFEYLSKRGVIQKKTFATFTIVAIIMLSIIYAFTISDIINVLQGPSPVDVTPIEMLEAHHIERVEEAIALLEFSEFITHFSVEEFEGGRVWQREFVFGYHYEEDSARGQTPRRHLGMRATVFVSEETAIERMQSARRSSSGFRYTEAVYDNGVEVVLQQTFMPVGSLRIPTDYRTTISHIRFGNTVVRLWEDSSRQARRNDISSHFISYLVEVMLEQDNH